MPTTLTDDFSGAAATEINGRTVSGRTYSVDGAFAADVSGLKLDGSGNVSNTSSNGAFARINAGSTTHGAKFTRLTNGGTILPNGPMVCAVDRNNYIALLPWTSGNGATDAELVKRVAGTQTRVVYLSGLTAFASGTDFELRWDPVAKKVTPYINGVAVGTAGGYSVTDAAFDGCTNAGFMASAGSQTSFASNFDFTDYASASLTITSGNPKANAVVQCDVGETSALMPFEFSYTGATPTDIRAQVEDASSNVLTAYAVVASADIGVGTITDVAVEVPFDPFPSSVGARVRFQMRDGSGNELASVVTNAFSVGDNTLGSGQSLMVGMFNTSGGVALQGRNAVYDVGTGAWSTASNIIAEYCNRRAAKIGMVVGVVMAAEGNRDVRYFAPAHTSTDGAVAAGAGAALITAALAGVGRVGTVLWDQGQTAISSYTAQKHTDALNAIVSGIKTATGRTGVGELRFLAAMVGSSSDLTDTYVQSVNSAILAATGVTKSHETYDLARADTVHLTTAGYVESARRFAEAGDAVGAAVSSATLSGTDITVSFTASLGGSTSGLTGWTVLGNGTPVTINTATRSGNTVTLGLGSTPSAPVTLRHAYGAEPTVTTITRSGFTPAGSSTAVPVQRTLTDVTVNDNSPPTNSVAPAVTGTAKVGQTLSCSTGTWSGSPTSYAYQWERDGASISGATSSTYQLQAADDETDIGCAVTATNANGTSSPVDSNTVAVTYTAPANTVLPSISGAAYVDRTLTCSTGTWDQPGTATYQWKRDGANIGGATSSSFLTTVTDLGTTLTCAVTLTNSGGNATATSAGKGPITEAPVSGSAQSSRLSVAVGIGL